MSRKYVMVALTLYFILAGLVRAETLAASPQTVPSPAAPVQTIAHGALLRPDSIRKIKSVKFDKIVDYGRDQAARLKIELETGYCASTYAPIFKRLDDSNIINDNHNWLLQFQELVSISVFDKMAVCNQMIEYDWQPTIIAGQFRAYLDEFLNGFRSALLQIGPVTQGKGYFTVKAKFVRSFEEDVEGSIGPEKALVTDVQVIEPVSESIPLKSEEAPVTPRQTPTTK